MPLLDKNYEVIRAPKKPTKPDPLTTVNHWREYQALKACDDNYPQMIDLLENIYWVQIMDSNIDLFPEDLFFDSPLNKEYLIGSFDTWLTKTFLNESAFVIWKWFRYRKRRKKKRIVRTRSIYKDTTFWFWNDFRRPWRVKFRHRPYTENIKSILSQTFSVGRFKKVVKLDPISFKYNKLHSVRKRLNFGSRLKDLDNKINPFNYNSFGLFIPRKALNIKRTTHRYYYRYYFFKTWYEVKSNNRLKKSSHYTTDSTLYNNNRDILISSHIPNNLFGLFIDNSQFYDILLAHRHKRKKFRFALSLTDSNINYYLLDPTYDRVSISSPLFSFEFLELFSFSVIFMFAIFYIFFIFRLHLFFSWLLHYIDHSDKVLLRVILGPPFHNILKKPIPLLKLLKFSLIPLFLILFFKMPFFYSIHLFGLNYLTKQEIPYNENGTLVPPLKRPLQHMRKNRQRYNATFLTVKDFEDLNFIDFFNKFGGREKRKRRAIRRRKRKNSKRIRRRAVRRTFKADVYFWKVRVREVGRTKLYRRITLRGFFKAYTKRSTRLLWFYRRNRRKFRKFRGITHYFNQVMGWRRGLNFYSNYSLRKQIRKWGSYRTFLPNKIKRRSPKIYRSVGAYSRRFNRTSLRTRIRWRSIKRRFWKTARFPLNYHFFRKYKKGRKRHRKKKKRTTIPFTGSGSSPTYFTWGARYQWKFGVIFKILRNRLYHFYHKCFKKLVLFKPYNKFLMNQITVYSNMSVGDINEHWTYQIQNRSLSTHLYDSLTFLYIFSLIRQFSSNILYLFGSYFTVIFSLIIIGVFSYLFSFELQPYPSAFYLQQINYGIWYKKSEQDDYNRSRGLSPIFKY